MFLALLSSSGQAQPSWGLSLLYFHLIQPPSTHTVTRNSRKVVSSHNTEYSGKTKYYVLISKVQKPNCTFTDWFQLCSSKFQSKHSPGFGWAWPSLFFFYFAATATNLNKILVGLANGGLSIFVERFWFHQLATVASWEWLFQVEYQIFSYSGEQLTKSLQNIHAITVYFRLELFK